MALVLADRVRDTTTTTGTGTITLSGLAPNGYQTFGSGVGNGNTTYYTITGGTEWEVGIGTYTSSGTTLSRDTVLASSNSGSLVNFSAGTKDVFVTYPAGKSIADGFGLLPVANGGTGAATLTGVVKGNGTSAFTAGTVSLTTEVADILPIANGGTGSNTASDAINALLPSQTSNSGKFLTTNGSAASWGTVPTGAMTLISTSTQSGANTSVAWTGLSGYDNYLIIASDVTMSAAASLAIQVGTGSTPTYVTSSYAYVYTVYSTSLGANNGGGSGSGNSWPFMGVYNAMVANGATSARPGSGVTYISGMLGSRPCYSSTQATYGYGTAGAMEVVNTGGGQPDTNAKTAIRLVSSSSATIYGTFSLYGITA